MPASLMMMALHARVQVLAEEPGNLAQFMTRHQQGHLRQVPEQPLHHVLLLRVRMPATGELAYANAGHNPPILVRANGDAEMLEGGGPVLGILSDRALQRDARAAGSRRHAGDLQRRRDRGQQSRPTTNSTRSASSKCCRRIATGRRTEIVQAVIKAVTEFRRRSAAGGRYHAAGGEAVISAHRLGSDQTAGRKEAPGERALPEAHEELRSLGPHPAAHRRGNRGSDRLPRSAPTAAAWRPPRSPSAMSSAWRNICASSPRASWRTTW